MQAIPPTLAAENARQCATLSSALQLRASRKGGGLFGEECLVVLEAEWHPSCHSYAVRLLKAVNT
jgi:hypothetical protein